MNILHPGTKEERGLIAWQNQMKLNFDDDDDDDTSNTYDFPVGMTLIRR